MQSISSPYAPMMTASKQQAGLRTCSHCEGSFEVTDDDLVFYDKISPVFNGKKYLIPPPLLCPECRMQHRMAFRNEKNLYYRTCEPEGKRVVSIYAQDVPLTIYSQDAWWGDSWDGRDYGRDFDFSKSFFEQFQELWHATPVIALWNINPENAEYNNNCFNNKNCYMNTNSDYCESTLYGYVCESCNFTADCDYTYHSELCYECTDCRKCYNCLFSSDLETCSDCLFSTDLIGCKRCFGCHGLRQKELHIFNKQVTEKEWKEQVESQKITAAFIAGSQKQSDEVRLTVPKRALKMIQCENSYGDHLYECRNVTNAYDVADAEECTNIRYAPFDSHHVRDSYSFGGAEWMYEYVGGGMNLSRLAFCMNCVTGCNDAYYCIHCVNGCKNLFGCVGLKKAQYCILNKQYSKEEYEELVPKIIEHMQSTGEWGKFFPRSISPFSYNETAAQEFFPLTKEEGEAKGWTWREQTDEKPNVEKIIPAEKLPETIEAIPDDILQWAIMCKVTGRPFRIIKQELDLYRQLKLPIPHLHPDERHRKRMRARNPQKLWNRNCAKCSKEMQTTYSPKRKEVVYCEECYLKEVY